MCQTNTRAKPLGARDATPAPPFVVVFSPLKMTRTTNARGGGEGSLVWVENLLKEEDEGRECASSIVVPVGKAALDVGEVSH